ncbi:SpoIIE family protein phosphatase [Candidatus Woesearchaeota archaeon]|nr:SpoIIE family protein phosphatase [Candidatus Woesearchaeota archaeon]
MGLKGIFVTSLEKAGGFFASRGLNLMGKLAIWGSKKFAYIGKHILAPIGRMMTLPYAASQSFEVGVRFGLTRFIGAGGARRVAFFLSEGIFEEVFLPIIPVYGPVADPLEFLFGIVAKRPEFISVNQIAALNEVDIAEMMSQFLAMEKDLIKNTIIVESQMQLDETTQNAWNNYFDIQFKKLESLRDGMAETLIKHFEAPGLNEKDKLSIINAYLAAKVELEKAREITAEEKIPETIPSPVVERFIPERPVLKKAAIETAVKEALELTEEIKAKQEQGIRLDERETELDNQNKAYAALLQYLQETEGLTKNQAEEYVSEFIIQAEAITAEEKLPQNIEASALYSSKEDVGGDIVLRTVVIIDGKQHVLMFNGDAVGKGLSASMIKSMLNDILSRRLESYNGEPGEFLKLINSEFMRFMSKEQFSTLALADINAETGEIKFAGAGAGAYILTSTGITESLGSTGPYLGLMPNYEFRTETRTLGQGDKVIIATDGVDEQLDIRKKQYGRERLNEVLRINTEKSPAALIDALINDLSEFSKGTERNDDIGISIFEFTGKPGVEVAPEQAYEEELPSAVENAIDSWRTEWINNPDKLKARMQSVLKSQLNREPTPEEIEERTQSILSRLTGPIAVEPEFISSSRAKLIVSIGINQVLDEFHTSVDFENKIITIEKLEVNLNFQALGLGTVIWNAEQKFYQKYFEDYKIFANAINPRSVAMLMKQYCATPVMIKEGLRVITTRKEFRRLIEESYLGFGPEDIRVEFNGWVNPKLHLAEIVDAMLENEFYSKELATLQLLESGLTIAEINSALEGKEFKGTASEFITQELTEKLEALSQEAAAPLPEVKLPEAAPAAVSETVYEQQYKSLVEKLLPRAESLRNTLLALTQEEFKKRYESITGRKFDIEFELVFENDLLAMKSSLLRTILSDEAYTEYNNLPSGRYDELTYEKMSKKLNNLLEKIEGVGYAPNYRRWFYIENDAMAEITDAIKKDVRFYVHLNSIENTAKFMNAVFREFASRDIPMLSKVMSRYGGFERSDAAVFYPLETDAAEVAEIITSVLAKHPDWVDEDTPLFTKKISKGVGYAQFPSSISFGEARTGNTAYAVADAVEKGITDKTGVFEFVRQEIEKSWVNIKKPYLDRGAEDILKDFVSPARTLEDIIRIEKVISTETMQAKVYEGTMRETGQKVIIKENKPDLWLKAGLTEENAQKASLDSLVEEQMNLKKVHEDFYNPDIYPELPIPETGIVPYIDFVRVSDEKAHLILGYIEGETLTEYLKHSKINPTAWLNLLKTINRLHAIGFIHGDLHRDNIMADKDGNLWILDFGLSYDLTSKPADYSALVNNDLKKFKERTVAYLQKKGQSLPYLEQLNPENPEKSLLSFEDRLRYLSIEAKISALKELSSSTPPITPEEIKIFRKASVPLAGYRLYTVGSPQLVIDGVKVIANGVSWTWSKFFPKQEVAVVKEKPASLEEIITAPEPGEVRKTFEDEAMVLALPMSERLDKLKEKYGSEPSGTDRVRADLALTNNLFENGHLSEKTESLLKEYLYPTKTMPAEEQQALLLEVMTTRVILDSNGDYITFADYLNKYYKDLGIRLEIKQEYLDQEMKTHILKEALVAYKKIHPDFEDENIWSAIDDLDSGKKDYAVFLESASEEERKFLLSMRAVFEDAELGTIPFIFIEYNNKITRIPIIASGSIKAAGLFISSKSSPGELGRVYINVRNELLLTYLLPTSIHEISHVIRDAVSESEYEKLIKERDNKKDELFEEFKQITGAEEIILMKAKLDRIDAEFKEKQSAIAEELEFDLLLDEGLAEIAIFHYLDNQFKGLQSKGIDMNYFDRLAFTSLMTKNFKATEYNLGFFIAKYYLLKYPELFNALYKADNTEDIPHFEEVLEQVREMQKQNLRATEGRKISEFITEQPQTAET